MKIVSKLGYIFLAAALISGCKSNRETDHAECSFEASKVILLSPKKTLDMDKNGLILDCMGAKGWKFNPSNDCTSSELSYCWK